MARHSSPERMLAIVALTLITACFAVPAIVLFMR